jgi:hypothetical protein
MFAQVLIVGKRVALYGWIQKELSVDIGHLESPCLRKCILTCGNGV